LRATKLAQAKAGVDGGLDHQPVLRWKGGQDGDELLGCERSGFFVTTLGRSVWAQGSAAGPGVGRRGRGLLVQVFEDESGLFVVAANKRAVAPAGVVLQPAG
jgi:hypothetical protein